MVAPYSCVRCVQGWALQWSAASCGRSPEGGRGWEALSCVFYCSIAETRHPSMAGFSKDTRRAESVAMPVLWKKYSFQETPLSFSNAHLSPIRSHIPEIGAAETFITFSYSSSSSKPPNARFQTLPISNVPRSVCYFGSKAGLIASSW